MPIILKILLGAFWGHVAHYLCQLFSASNLPSDLLVLVGIGGIWAALRTLDVIKDQTKATKDAAVAAKQNIDLIIRKERAYLEVRAPQPLDFNSPVRATNSLFPVRYEVFFNCPVGAIITETCAWALVLAEMFAEERGVSLSIDEIPNFIRPETKNIECVTWLFSRPAGIQQVEKSESAVHFYGFIKYRNVHMEDSEPDLIEKFPMFGFRRSRFSKARETATGRNSMITRSYDKANENRDRI